MSKLKRGIMISMLSLSLVMGLASSSLAMEGMGNSPVPSETHEATPGMDSSMPGMDMGESKSTPSKALHEATPGMDSDMPGMETPSSDGHREKESSEGVNWSVVGGFLAINLLIIAIAGVLKFTQKPKIQVVE